MVAAPWQVTDRAVSVVPALGFICVCGSEGRLTVNE